MKKRIYSLFAALVAIAMTAQADNVVTADKLLIAKSGTADLTIKLANTDVVTGIQFKLTLPAGVAVQGSDAGITYDVNGMTKNYYPLNGVKATVTSKTAGWSVLGNKLSENTYIFVLFSLTGKTLAASAAEAVMKISFTAAADVTPGKYAVELSDIHLAVAGTAADSQVANHSADLTVVGGIRGDANADGSVSVTDIAVVVNDILRLPNTGGYSEYGADANGDGSISVTDIGVIVDKILGTSNSSNNDGSRKMQQEQQELEPQ